MNQNIWTIKFKRGFTKPKFLTPRVKHTAELLKALSLFLKKEISIPKTWKITFADTFCGTIRTRIWNKQTFNITLTYITSIQYVV